MSILSQRNDCMTTILMKHHHTIRNITERIKEVDYWGADCKLHEYTLRRPSGTRDIDLSPLIDWCSLHLSGEEEKEDSTTCLLEQTLRDNRDKQVELVASGGGTTERPLYVFMKQTLTHEYGGGVLIRVYVLVFNVTPPVVGLLQQLDTREDDCNTIS